MLIIYAILIGLALALIGYFGFFKNKPQSKKTAYSILLFILGIAFFFGTLILKTALGFSRS